MKKLLLFLLFSMMVILSGCGGEMPKGNTPSNTNRPPGNVTPLPSATLMANKPADNSSNSKSSNKANNANEKPAVTPQSTPTPSQTGDKKDEGLFSFPPPKPTGVERIEIAKLMNREGPTTFADVSAKLSKGLEKAGYSGPNNYSYFWNDSDEFAIVTQIERINNDGTPLDADNRRWDISDSLPKANLEKYLSYLISGKKVFYRVFAFIVTKKSYNFKRNSPPSFELARDWMNKGYSSFGEGESAPIQRVVFDEKYHCYALLYLFVNHTSLDNPKSVDSLKGGEQGLAEDLKKEAKDHLAKTGIVFGE